MKLPQMGQEMVRAGRERRICILAYWPAGVSYPGVNYPGERYTRRQIHQGCLLKAFLLHATVVCLRRSSLRRTLKGKDLFRSLLSLST